MCKSILYRYVERRPHITIKKTKFSSYTCIRKLRCMGSGAKSYMRKGFLSCEEMRKYLTLYEETVSHIWLCNRFFLNFFICQENFIFFFISDISKKIFALLFACLFGICCENKNHPVVLTPENHKKENGRLSGLAKICCENYRTALMVLAPRNAWEKK